MTDILTTPTAPAVDRLHAARRNKNDEFYTLWGDIEKEVLSYLDYDKDAFRGKTVLLPCDDPEWSNFTKFFAEQFDILGLKKLISTSYNAGGTGKMFIIEEDITRDGRTNMDDIVIHNLKGDGDFRSDEVRALRDESDIIVTNPPFSLFREFLAWIMEADKKFLVIGNINAITYKETFPIIKANKMWLGVTEFNLGMYFGVPEDFVYAPTYKFDRERDGVKVSRVAGVCWFTNIDHGRRHDDLPLMTMADNQRYNRGLGATAYVKYHNFDAIEVPKVAAIPLDYDGLMGVPITFLDKYNPDQFEIIGTSGDLGQRMSTLAERGTYQQGGPAFYTPNGDGTYDRIYKRIVIRRRPTV